VHTCDSNGDFGGGSCTRNCYSSERFVIRDDYIYGLMSGAPKDAADNGCDFGSFVPVPSGWELPPADGTFLDVAQTTNWNTHVVEASNGWSAYTANHGARGWFCNDSATDTNSCNVLENAMPGTEWNLHRNERSWSQAPPYHIAWNQTENSW